MSKSAQPLTVDSKGLIIGDPEVRDTHRLVLEMTFPQLRFEEADKKEFATMNQIVGALKKKYEFFILPLTLPRYNSLRIAEKVHQLDWPTRLILVSASKGLLGNPDLTSRLFDAYVPYQPGYETELISAFNSLMQTPLKPRLSQKEELIPAIKTLLDAHVWAWDSMCDMAWHHSYGATLESYHDAIKRSGQPGRIAKSKTLSEIPRKTIIIKDGGKYVETDHSKEFYTNNAPNQGNIGKWNRIESAANYLSANPDLQKLLDNLCKEVASLSAPDAKNLRGHVEKLYNETKKIEPDPGKLKLTCSGLIEAAKACAGMAPSVLNAASIVANWFAQNKAD